MKLPFFQIKKKMITFPMAQCNMQMYSGHGPKLIYYMSLCHCPPHPTISHTKYQIYSFGALCVKGTRAQ